MMHQSSYGVCSVHLPGNDFESFGDGVEYHLFLAHEVAGCVSEELGQAHLGGAAAGHDLLMLQRSPDHHDGVV